ncbi:transcriptional repressor [Candidatus Saccharibacteria bacterium]|nr:transcriptional repressor [Candidatus Saccharibacteria bacterium]MCL1963179.1 transcriptional repressor [Candidatus Saccharibacteria bacterium]
MQDLDEIFLKNMRKAGLRVTENRRAIFRVLNQVNEPLSIQKIASLIADEAHFTSIYRSVDAMTRAGILRVVSRGFKNLYELGEIFRPHHHHATCKKCGATVQINDERLEKIMSLLARQAGFQAIEHHFEIIGICQKCQGDVVK